MAAGVTTRLFDVMDLVNLLIESEQRNAVIASAKIGRVNPVTLRSILAVCLLGGFLLQPFGQAVAAQRGRSQISQPAPSYSTANEALGYLDFELSFPWKPGEGDLGRRSSQCRH